MNIYLENVNLDSNSGPNSFGRKLVKYMGKAGHTFDMNQKGDVALAFIQSNRQEYPIPLVQRLDGVYFNTLQNYKAQNHLIQETYKKADGIIFQSNFSRDLVFEYFGPHNNYTIVHNGADVEEIEETEPIQVPDRFSEMWSCASSWRPHKRLDDNIEYFFDYAPDDACFVIAGQANNRIKDPRVFYVGDLNQNQLYSLYKASTHFIHLGWLDNCPNVVVDARACGCKIVCCSAGGTIEVAGPDAIVVKDGWDFKPTNLYQPPKLDFSVRVNDEWDIDYNMVTAAKKYEQFMESVRKRHE